MRLVALAGGTGAAKLLRGLDTLLERGAMTVVGNTGDDAEIWGLHVSPDLDTVCYTLGGLLDEERGWAFATRASGRSAKWAASAGRPGSTRAIEPSTPPRPRPPPPR